MSHAALTDEQRAERWTLKLQGIFENIGLNAEGIRAVSRGVSVPVIHPVETPKDERPRASCPYCGRRVGKCVGFRRPARGTVTNPWQGAWP